jgi:hypothetical protein
MVKMFLLFSHKLTEDQVNEAKNVFQISEFVSLPEDLQRKWSNVPPEIDDVELENYAKQFTEFINENRTSQMDLVFLAGEPGLVHVIASKIHGCVYATTLQEKKEERQPDGSVKKISVFKHCRFRHFNRY